MRERHEDRYLVEERNTEREKGIKTIIRQKNEMKRNTKLSNEMKSNIKWENEMKRNAKPDK